MTTVPPKCYICHNQRSVYIWQPFGPDESPLLFVRPGYHYRGFPLLHVCADCRRDIIEGKPVKIFRWNKGQWLYKDGALKRIE